MLAAAGCGGSSGDDSTTAAEHHHRERRGQRDHPDRDQPLLDGQAGSAGQKKSGFKKPDQVLKPGSRPTS